MKTTAEINDWRKANPGQILDLHGANLTGANLQHADLRDANLRGTDLTGANHKRYLSIRNRRYKRIHSLCPDKKQ
jgi:uncharacterized protein YjbI with pentapeptide repeats